MKLETKNLNEIKPYWRNPRITDEAVKAVKSSISSFGFNQPLIIDAENVIIAGHVRYRALRELGFTDADCVVVDMPPSLAKQYRIADNKTAEIAVWDVGKLTLELREIGDLTSMIGYFPGGELEALMNGAVMESYGPVTAEDLSRRETALSGTMTDRAGASTTRYAPVTCPECGHDFNINAEEFLAESARTVNKEPIPS